jgi:hypothetical protein
MGHYCWVCDRSRPNEKFSGKGHRVQICKDCMQLPREVRKHLREVDEVVGFLSQSNISARNLERLKILAESEEEEVAGLAKVVAEVAKAHPRKRRRLKFLATKHKDLVGRLDQLGIARAN